MGAARRLAAGDRSGTPRGRRRAVLVLGSTAVVLCLGLATAFAAGWLDRTRVSAGVVTAGQLSLVANNVATYTIPAASISPLAPGEVKAAEVTIAGTATGKNNRQTLQLSPVTATGDATVLSNLTLQISALTGAQTCSSTVVGTLRYSGALVGASFGPQTLVAAGQGTASTRLCLRVGLAAGAPSSVNGKSVSISLSFVGQQARP